MTEVQSIELLGDVILHVDISLTFVWGEILAIQTYDTSRDDGIEQSFRSFTWLSVCYLIDVMRY